MDQSQLNGITNFIWGIADDVLRAALDRGGLWDGMKMPLNSAT